MNKFTLLLILIFSPTITIAADLDEQQRDDICRLMIDEHHLVAHPIARKSFIKIEGQKPRHVIEGMVSQFSGNEGKYLSCAASTDVSVLMSSNRV